MNKIFKKLCLVLSIVLVFCLFTSCTTNLDNANNVDDNSSTNNSTQQEEQQVDFSSLTYVAFGDSITFGANWRKDGICDGSKMENPYPELVAQVLNLKQVNNLAYGGSTLTLYPTEQCITNKILNYSGSADIVSVMGGINDWGKNIPLGIITDNTVATIYGSLNLIANAFATKFQNAFCFFMTPYNTTATCDSNYSLLDVANAVKEVANKYNIPVLDMYTYGNFELEMYQYGSDGVHPSQEFFKNYTAPQIAKFIKDNYKNKTN